MRDDSIKAISLSILDTARGHIADDDIVDERQIAAWVRDYRAMLIKQNFDRNPSYIDPAIIQSLGGIEMEVVDSSEVSTLITGLYMLRSVKAIPNLIPRNNGLPAATRIGPADNLSIKYHFTTHEAAISSGHLRFNEKAIYAFMLDSKLYIYSRNNKSWKGTKYTNIRGVFQDPRDVVIFKSASDGLTFESDIEYPISNNMRAYVENLILKDKFGIGLMEREDTINQGKHDLENALR